MRGLGPRIHVFLYLFATKTWMAGTSPIGAKLARVPGAAQHRSANATRCTASGTCGSYVSAMGTSPTMTMWMAGSETPWVLHALRRGNGSQRVLEGARHLGDSDVTHAQVMVQAAERFVARAARKLARGLDCRGDGIKRTPVPCAGRPKYSDHRSAERGRDMKQP